MPTLIVEKPFRFSPDGTNVVDYAMGEHEVNDRCAEVAQQEGWGRVKREEPVTPRRGRPRKGEH